MDTIRSWDEALATLPSIAVVEGATLVTHDSALLDGSMVGLRAEDWLAPPHSS